MVDDDDVNEEHLFLSLSSPVERGNTFDWETLLDQQAVATKRRISVKELSPGMKSTAWLLIIF